MPITYLSEESTTHVDILEGTVGSAKVNSSFNVENLNQRHKS